MRQGATISRTLYITVVKGVNFWQGEGDNFSGFEDVETTVAGKHELEKAEKLVRNFMPNFAATAVRHERHRYTMSTIDFINNSAITDKENENE